MILSKHNFFTFSKTNLKTRFINQSNVTPAFTQSIDHASKANFYQDMMFPKNDFIIVNGTF